MKHHTSSWFALLVWVCLASHASAGTVVSLETVMFKTPSGSGTATVYLEEKRMRIDSTEGGGDITVIYNGEGRENPYYWIIDNRAGSYVEIREDELRQAAALATQALGQARRELADRPPAERKEMERTYAERMGYAGFLEDETQYKKISSGIKVGQWKCDHYQGFREGEKIEEVWAAGLGELGIDPKDLNALEELANLFKTVGQSLPAFFRFGGDKSDSENTFPGFPVMVVSYDRGDRAEKSTLTGVKQQKLEATLFDLPEGLTRRSEMMKR